LFSTGSIKHVLHAPDAPTITHTLRICRDHRLIAESSISGSTSARIVATLGLMAGFSSPRYAGRIVATLGLMAGLLLAPLRGAHRRRA
jgi:hypothetical protein